MNFLFAIGNTALSIICSILGNMIDRYIQQRKEIDNNPECKSCQTCEKSPSQPKA